MNSFELIPTEENLIHTLDKDLLKRNKDLVRFYDLILVQEGASSIAIDGRWGSGKTFFVKQSMLLINAKNPMSDMDDEKKASIVYALPFPKKAEDMPENYDVAVYYDAWENDNGTDPVLSLVYEIIKQLGINYAFDDNSNAFKLAGSVLEALTGRNINGIIENLKSDNPLTKIKEEKDLRVEDRWILNKLNNLIKTVSQNINDYDLGVALENIYNFIWNEFCDWYIEMAKSRLYSENKQEKAQVCYVLNYVLRNSLKLLHPFMPFITSEIYAKLVNPDNRDLMVSDWPKANDSIEYDTSKDFIENLKDVITQIRNVRANMNVHPSKKTKLIFVTAEYQNEIEQSKAFIEKLGFANEITIQNNKDNIPQNAISIISNGMEVYIPFEELVDVEEEKKRLEDEKKKVLAEIERASKMLANPGFVNKAPEAKINEEKAKLNKYQEMLKSIEERIK